MSELLRRDVECEGLLECFHGLTDVDEAAFRVLHESPEALTVDEVAGQIGRERTTAYRALQRLERAGFVRMEQINYEQGGYYHVYHPRPGAEVTRDLQRTLNDWYAKMGQLIDEFGEKYDGEREDVADAEKYDGEREDVADAEKYDGEREAVADAEE